MEAALDAARSQEVGACATHDCVCACLLVLRNCNVYLDVKEDTVLRVGAGVASSCPCICYGYLHACMAVGVCMPCVQASAIERATAAALRDKVRVRRLACGVCLAA